MLDIVMASATATTANTVWFLAGPFDSAETVRHLPLYAFPFTIGRRQDLHLALSCKTVSTLHAEITEVGGRLVLRDLGSTNGTYVNGRRVHEPVVLAEDDLVQFANLPFRIRMHSTEDSPNTLRESACDQALALVMFDKLMAERAVTPFLQPIVKLDGRARVGYEVLARSRLFGLESPGEMFGVATQLNLEVELSTMLRWEGVRVVAVDGPPSAPVPQHASSGDGRSAARAVAGTAAGELARPAHHAGNPRIGRYQRDRAVGVAALLKRLDIKLAYDDFGVGQSRLNELAEVAPDCVKFDMSLIRGHRQRHGAAAAVGLRAGADGPQPGHCHAGGRRGDRGRGGDLPANGLRTRPGLSLRPSRAAAGLLIVTAQVEQFRNMGGTS